MVVRKFTVLLACFGMGLFLLSAQAWAVASLEVTATNGQDVLPGQTISLFTESGTEVKQDQQRGGVTYFSNLEPGTYTIKTEDKEIRTITILPQDTVKRIGVVIPATLIGTASAPAATATATTTASQTGNLSVNIQNANAAADVKNAVTRAQNAIASGDKTAFDGALNQLKDIQKFFNATAKSGGALGDPQQAAVDRDTIKTLRSDLQSRWDVAQTTGGDNWSAGDLKLNVTTIEMAGSPAILVTRSFGDIVPAAQCGPNCLSVGKAIDEAIDQALWGIQHCNEDAYEDAIDWLMEIADEDVPEVKAREIDDTINRLDGQWNKTFPCSQKPRKNPFAYFRYEFGIGSGFVRLSDSLRYLGFENAGVQRLGVVSTEDRGSHTSIDNELRFNIVEPPNTMPNFFNMVRRPRLDVFTGLRYAESDIHQNIGAVSTGGDILLLPGVGAGPNPAGFNAGVNDVSNATYKYDMEMKSFRLGMGQTYEVANQNGRVRPYIGLEYSEQKHDLQFMGSIPALVRDFSYVSRVENNFFSPMIGIEGSIRPAFLQGLGPTPIELRGAAQYSLNFNDVDGHDTLALTGFNPGTANLDEDGTTHSFGFQAGLTINPDGPFSVTLGGNVQSMGNAIDLERTGTDLTQVEFGRSLSATGEFRGNLRF